MSTRRLHAGLVSLVVAAGTVGGASSAAARNDDVPAEPLTILLTNDDGWNAPGITAVYDALVAAGHDVSMVAPAVNQSGTGARVTFSGDGLTLTRHEEDKYSVTGTPADATEVGLSLLFADEPPDLVISGTNVGHNVAAVTIHSGTVGAAATALKDGVPAIAISTEVTRTPQGQLGPYGDTAGWLVRLLAALKERAGAGPLLPAGTGLNINYPIVGDATTGGQAPVGVAWTVTGNGYIDVEYPSATLPALGESVPLSIRTNQSAPETTPNADSTALFDDHISVTPIEGDYDAPAQGLGQLRNTVVRVR